MRKQLMVMGAIFFLVSCVLIALDSPVFADEAKRTFVGAAKCKTCHKTAAQGEQFPIWEKSAHAGAYETLASEQALAIGKKVGVAEPQKSDTCLRCHVTGHGVAAELLGTKYAVTDGVGCESCHGAGGDYYKKATMSEITAGTLDRAKVGLVKPDEKTCTGCHNDQSPTFKGFDYEKYLAKIAHPIPEERKAKHKAGGSK